MKKIGYALMMVVLAGVLSVVFTNTVFAGGPKCPCYKAKDLEKLLKKGWIVRDFTQEPEWKWVYFYNKEIWDYSKKGNNMTKSFEWFPGGGDEDVCVTIENQYKWKTNNYQDVKSKSKTRPMPTGSADSAECAAILDDFISSLP